MRADRPFELSVEGSPHLAVADPDRLEQVLWALLDNAVKYSPAGSPIDVAIDGSDGRARRSRSSIAGAGWTQATRDRAFEQFYRSDQARKLAPDGSGVGLYAAHGLMRAMDGSVEIDSELGRGTSVRLGIPAESSAEGVE